MQCSSCEECHRRYGMHYHATTRSLIHVQRELSGADLYMADVSQHRPRCALCRQSARCKITNYDSNLPSARNRRRRGSNISRCFTRFINSFIPSNPWQETSAVKLKVCKGRRGRRRHASHRTNGNACTIQVRITLNNTGQSPKQIIMYDIR